MPDRFDEQKLLADIVSVWGAHGAHADLARWMIGEITQLRKLLAETIDMLGKSIDMLGGTTDKTPTGDEWDQVVSAYDEAGRG